MAGRWEFIPVDATLAPGPYTPPSKSDSRAGVNGSVLPPGGPDKNFAMANRKGIYNQHGKRKRVSLTVLCSMLVPLNCAGTVLDDTNACPVTETQRHLSALISTVCSKSVVQLCFGLVYGYYVAVPRCMEERQVCL